jgi:AcrR family transcriptional regulator
MEDRRTAKTQKALKKALVELIQKRDINNITVTDLSESADIGRGTFYLHYQNPYDLLANFENDIINDLETIQRTYENNMPADLSLCIEKILDYMVENKIIIKILLDPQKNYSFLNKLEEFFINKLEESFISKTLPITADWEYFRYHASFIIMGVIGIVQEWIKNDMDLPSKKVAEIMEIILSNPKIQF